MRSVLGGWRLPVMAAGLGPALVACAAPMACTAVGCVSMVTVDVTSLAARARPVGAEATLCIADACQTTKVSFGADAGSMVFGQLPRDLAASTGAQVPVTLKVVQGNTVLLDTTTTATLDQIAPNGLECGPVCYVADLVVDGRTLKPSPKPTATS